MFAFLELRRHSGYSEETVEQRQARFDIRLSEVLGAPLFMMSCCKYARMMSHCNLVVNFVDAGTCKLPRHQSHPFLQLLRCRCLLMAAGA